MNGKMDNEQIGTLQDSPSPSRPGPSYASTDYTKSVRSRAAVKRASRAADVRDEAAANQQRGLTAHQADVREENLRSLQTQVNSS